MQYADHYSGSWHIAEEKLGKAFSKLLERKKIDYRVLIDLHDMTPPNKDWKDGMRERGEYWIKEVGVWAEHYVDKNDDVVFTWYPHFLISLRQYDRALKKAVKKYLIERQQNIPPIHTGREITLNERDIAREYMEWYKKWSEKRLKLLPARLELSGTPKKYDIGKNHIIIEFVPKVDYLTDNMRNGNVKQITIEDGYNFIKSMIDYFLKNPYESQQTIE